MKLTEGGYIATSFRSLPRFDLMEPATAEEAVDILNSAVNPSLLAGGTDLCAQFNEGFAPGVLIDLGGIQALRKIEITRADPSADTAHLRTFKDAGFADMDPRAWFGIFAPKGTPAGIIKKIQRDIAEILAEPEFRKREAQDRGYIPGGMPTEEFATEIKEDYAMKGRLIKTLNIKVEN